MISRDGFARVDGEGKNVRQHLGLGKARGLHVNRRFTQAGIDEVFRVLAVHDGEIALVAEQVGVRAQDAVADGVERAAPQRGQFLAQQVAHAAHHFLARPCW